MVEDHLSPSQWHHKYKAPRFGCVFGLATGFVLASLLRLLRVQPHLLSSLASPTRTVTVNRTFATLHDNDDETTMIAQLLRNQVRAQDDFQRFIATTQTPSDCRQARILYKALDDKTFDGFANEIQFMIRYLQYAVATNRVLAVTKVYPSAYAPEDCHGGGLLSCLWNMSLIASCDPWEDNYYDKNNASRLPQHIYTTLPEPMGIGHRTGQQSSQYFDVGYYGPLRNITVVRKPHKLGQFKLQDVVAHTERQFGRFWVRSQMAHYWWNRPTTFMRQIMDREVARFSHIPRPYIAFHIRKTDNVKTFERDFGRNTDTLRSLDRYMHLARQIRQHHPQLRHIFVATDNEEIAEETARYTKNTHSSTNSNNHTHVPDDWTFYLQTDIPRGTADSEWMWFEDIRSSTLAGITLDVEVMRRADFLVGSFSSNVYRLAAELNTAYHAPNYLWTGQRRIYGVDVEWYEAP